MATVLAVNGAATLDNIDLKGTFDFTNVISATAIPINTIGLDQLLVRLINNINNIKSTISIAERQLRADLSADVVGTITVNPPVQIASLEAVTAAFQDRNNLSGAVATKPSLLDDGANFYAEDGLFQFFSQISYEIMKLRYNLVLGDNNGMTGGFPGFIALIVSVVV